MSDAGYRPRLEPATSGQQKGSKQPKSSLRTEPAPSNLLRVVQHARAGYDGR
jgi:hypothetical protein